MRELPTSEWLEHEYVVLGRSGRQIGRDVGVSHKTVYRWLNRMGIPRRTLSEAMHATPSFLRKSKGYVSRRAHRVLVAAAVPGQCAVCGATSDLEAHHKDRDRENDSLENLQYLCIKCHHSEHSKEGG